MGCTFDLFVVNVVAASLYEASRAQRDRSSSFAPAVVAMLFLFGICYACTWGTVAFLVPAGIWSLGLRAKGNGFGITGWALGVGVTVLPFPSQGLSLANRHGYISAPVSLRAYLEAPSWISTSKPRSELSSRSANRPPSILPPTVTLNVFVAAASLTYPSPSSSNNHLGTLSPSSRQPPRCFNTFISSGIGHIRRTLSADETLTLPTGKVLIVPHQHFIVP
ncbi:hypothetical protein VTK26DRAFT_4888 [Humicola hyalothermophila]